jgi:hypothetical protein
VQRCRESLVAFDTAGGDLQSHWFLSVSALCLRSDVIEVTHGLAAATSKGLLRLSESAGQLRCGAVGGRDCTAQGSADWLLAQRFAIGPEQVCTLAADNADHENGGIANSRLRILKDQA